MKFTKRSIAEKAAKFGLWTLVFAVSFWSFNRNEWISTALANYTTTTLIGTQTQTQTLANGQVIVHQQPVYATITITSTATSGDGFHTEAGTSTGTNCINTGSLYGGGSSNYCNRTDPTQQKNSQQDTQGLNNNGADQSTALGMAAIAAGMAMVAAGMALMSNPPTIPAGVALIAAGMALIASGMAALAAAGKMNNNANKAGDNGYKLDNLAPYQSTISGGTSANTDTGTGSSDLGGGGTNKLGDGTSSGIKIDPALLRSGKIDGIMQDMEQKTGINRDDLASGLANGGNPLNMLANSPALAGKPAASADNLQKMMDDTMAKGNLPSSQDVMDKLGLTPGDLNGGKGNLAGGDGSGGGEDPNRGLASGANGANGANGAGGPNIDALFPGKGDQSGSSGGDAMKVSPEVQAALDKNGITGRTIFQMVHSQYVKKTPLMFGVQNKQDGTAPNPFATLNGDKVDL